MKKAIFLLATTLIMYVTTHAQEAYTQQLQTTVTRLDKATTARDYQQLANDFLRIAEIRKTQWLPYYYAAFCNSKVGWLKQNDDPDNIEPFANKAEQEINTAESLIDTVKQQKELSEIYCIKMMLNQARVFINPQTYGPKYGPDAFNYTQLSKKANADNPRMLYLLGWQKFATPKMFGGDKALAKQLLIEAKQKLSTESPTSVDPHWGKNEADGLLKQLK